MNEETKEKSILTAPKLIIWFAVIGLIVLVVSGIIQVVNMPPRIKQARELANQVPPPIYVPKGEVNPLVPDTLLIHHNGKNVVDGEDLTLYWFEYTFEDSKERVRLVSDFFEYENDFSDLVQQLKDYNKFYLFTVADLEKYLDELYWE